MKMYIHLCSWRWYSMGRCFLTGKEKSQVQTTISSDVYLLFTSCYLSGFSKAPFLHIVTWYICDFRPFFFFSLMNLLMLLWYCLLPFTHLFLISPQALPWTQIPQSDEMNKIVTFVFRNTMQKDRRKKITENKWQSKKTEERVISHTFLDLFAFCRSLSNTKSNFMWPYRGRVCVETHLA